MIAFLDESGIHLKTGHSVFTVVHVLETDLDDINSAVQDIEQSLGPVPFHWSKLRWENRAKAFKVLRKLPFEFEIAIFNNPLSNADKAMHETLGRILSGAAISRIYIDGVKSKAYAAKLRVSLRQAGISTKKITTVKDESFPGIRIADLIAGAYRHQLDKPSPESAKLQALISGKQK